MATVWMNGRLIDDDTAHVSIKDLGLLHGIGVFTTMRSHQRRVRSLAPHLSRVRASCDAFAIPLTYTEADLETALTELLADQTFADARIRLTVTRGTQRTDPTEGVVLEPTVFITATPVEGYPKALYDKGMTALAYDAFKLNPYDPQAGHKTLDYLSRFSALRDAQQRTANEALLFNVHNYLQSGSMSNVFLVKDSGLLTPPTQEDLKDETIAKATPYPRSNVLPGVTRGEILELAKEDALDVTIRALTVNDLLEADEVFLTNSVIGVMPVCRIERKEVGTGKPGEITTLLAGLYAQAGDE
jgi:branched-chain amino acid aminotransferase